MNALVNEIITANDTGRKIHDVYVVASHIYNKLNNTHDVNGIITLCKLVKEKCEAHYIERANIITLARRALDCAIASDTNYAKAQENFDIVGNKPLDFAVDIDTLLGLILLMNQKKLDVSKTVCWDLAIFFGKKLWP